MIATGGIEILDRITCNVCAYIKGTRICLTTIIGEYERQAKTVSFYFFTITNKIVVKLFY